MSFPLGQDFDSSSRGCRARDVAIRNRLPGSVADVLADHRGRGTSRQAQRRDLRVFGYNTAGGDDGLIVNRGPVEDNYVYADERSLPYGIVGADRPKPDRSVGTHVNPFVIDQVVQNVGPFPDLDRLIIPSEHDAGSDTRVNSKRHIADNCGVGMAIGDLVNCRTLPVGGLEHLFDPSRPVSSIYAPDRDELPVHQGQNDPRKAAEDCCHAADEEDHVPKGDEGLDVRT